MDSKSGTGPLIKAEGLVKNYRLGQLTHQALKKVDIEVKPGELLAIAGTSGSGKTTLLNILGGVDKPDSGQVSVAGTNITRMKDSHLAGFRAQNIGFIFQTFNLIPTLTALENVEYPLLLLGVEAKLRRKLASEALAEVGLDLLKNNWPSAMSGGQRQRVAVARAIVKKPKLILADEPTASLDKGTAGELLALLQKLNKNHGITIIFSTHDPLVLSRATRIMRLSDGQEVKADVA